MKALFELFRRFDARRIFGFIRRLLGMSRPKVKCYDLLSNHALRVEGDLGCRPVTKEGNYFYPRPPCGGRHITSFRIVFTDPISIHALRVEGDYHWDNHRRVRPDHFYPRPPGGGRPLHGLAAEAKNKFLSTPSGWRATTSSAISNILSGVFLSTPSGWRATEARQTIAGTVPISIHALRVEGDDILRQSAAVKR